MKNDRPAAPRARQRGTLHGLKTRTLAVVVLCLTGVGCTVPALTGALQVAEYGTSTFTKGSLETYYQNTVDEVVIAVRAMVNDLGLRPVSDHPKDDFLYLKVMDEAGQDIYIRVKRRARMLTSISIRVGLLGDETYSTALMREVTEQLAPEIVVGPRPDRTDPTADDPRPAKPPEEQTPAPRRTAPSPKPQ
jgi:hypothetical protein